MALGKMTRREALRAMLGTSASTLFTTSMYGCTEQKISDKSKPNPGPRHPNILVIMSDDQGAGDMGYVGNKWARTPIIDSLAAESAMFTNFIAAPACTPSRASFLTGRNYNHTGVWGVGPRGYIRRDETFLPEYLRRAGYRTAHFGKWGEGWTPDQRSYKRGYDEAAALGGGYQHKDSWVDYSGKLEQAKGWTTDVLADLTIDFIRRQTEANQPWYAIAAYIAPHSPWECAPEYSEPLKKQGYSDALAAFYGMVQQMDTATGRILDEIEKLGVTDDTIVIFVSDNGASPLCLLTGGTPIGSDDWKRRNFLYLRGQKATAWENGIRVPFTIRWPKHIPAGRRTQLGSYEDILPTILDLAGVPDSIVPGHLPLHGISLKPVLFAPSLPEEERFYFRIPVSLEGSPNSYPELIIEDLSELRYSDIHTSLYGPRFKYHSLPGGKELLYDMDDDPGETTDLSTLRPGITRRMAAVCRKEWDSLIESGRGFWMPSTLIGDSRYADMKRCWAHLPPNVVPCNTAQRVSGTVSCPFEGVRGFSEAGDSATFSIDIRRAGKYEIAVTGENLDSCGPFEIDIDGMKLMPEEISDKKIRFGTISLPVKAMDFNIIAKADGKSPAYMREIGMQPVAE